MIHELEPVVLTHDLADSGLRKGDVGAVVHVYESATTYEVEFVCADGRTVALLTLSETDVRPMSGDEILHVRTLVSA